MPIITIVAKTTRTRIHPRCISAAAPYPPSTIADTTTRPLSRTTPPSIARFSGHRSTSIQSERCSSRETSPDSVNGGAPSLPRPGPRLLAVRDLGRGHDRDLEAGHAVDRQPAVVADAVAREPPHVLVAARDRPRRDAA